MHMLPGRYDDILRFEVNRLCVCVCVCVCLCLSFGFPHIHTATRHVHMLACLENVFVGPCMLRRVHHAACAVDDQPIGIDIEIIHPRIAKVAHKFLNDREKAMIETLDEKDQLNQLAFLWAAKEAMYKKYEQLGIDFANDFNILELTKGDRGSVPAQILHKGNHISVHLDYHFGADYICVTCYN